MFFNPDETYDKAIYNRDVGALKTLLVGIIGSDPTFVTSEFEEAQEYIRNKSMAVNGEEIILGEDYQVQEDEYEKIEWDERFFQMNLVWLRDNFALSERLPEIKKIGKYVYKDKQTLGKMKVRNRQHSTSSAIHNNSSVVKRQKESTEMTTKDDYKEKQLSEGGYEWSKNNWHWLLLVVIIIILALIFIIRGKVDKNDDISEMNVNTARISGVGNERNKKDNLDETFCFAIEKNMD